MSRIKETNIKTRAKYLFEDIINIKNFDPNRIKIDRKWYKNIIIYYIGYIAIKNIIYVKINTVNPLCLIIDKADEYIEECSGNKYLTLVSTDKNKDIKKVCRTME